MKKSIFILIILSILFFSCSLETEKDQRIIELNNQVANLKAQIASYQKIEDKSIILEETSSGVQNEKNVEAQLAELEGMIVKLKLQIKELIVKNKTEQSSAQQSNIQQNNEQINNNQPSNQDNNQDNPQNTDIITEQSNISVEIPEEKLLDAKFYCQAIRGNFRSPYEDFCEEASFLNGYYYLMGKQPSLEDYDKDLWKIKKFEDSTFDGGYVSTSLQQTLEFIKAFQGDEQKVSGKIIENPTIDIMKEYLAKGNPIIVPTYGKGLRNPHFTGGGPTYHNLLVVGYKDNFFITNEVGISKGDKYMYKQDLLLENIFDYDPALYPKNFKQGKKRILVLYKNNIEE